MNNEHHIPGERRFFPALLVTASLFMTALSCLGSIPATCTQARDGGRAYTPHDPISLSGSYTANATNGITGGSGTENDPYIVSGWDITSTDQPGFNIAYNEANLKIVNCRFHDIPAGFSGLTDLWSDAPITVENCEFVNNDLAVNVGYFYGGGTMSGCTFSGNRESMLLRGQACDVKSCTFTGGTIGINCSDEGRVLDRNTFTGVSTAILLGQGAKQSTILNSSIQGGQIGISVQGLSDSNGGKILNNTISGVPTAISLSGGAPNMFIGYNLLKDGATGVEVTGSDENHIVTNIFENFSGFAVSLTGSQSTLVVDNNFISNAGGGTQASSNKAGNEWNSGFTSTVWWTGTKAKEGNYWSDQTGPDLNRDGFVDSPYTMSGGLEKDYYPLVMKVPYAGPFGQPRTAKVVASQTGGAAPLSVNFVPDITAFLTGIPSEDVDMPYTFGWSFGDGGTSTDALPMHTFTSAGTYNVVLTVTNSTGATVQSPPLVITATGGGGNPLAASATADRTGGNIPLTIAFTATASGGTPPYTYSWNFGDGNNGAGSAVSHVFATAGTFSVVLTVTDSASATKTASALSVTTTSGGGGGGNPLAVAAAADKTGGAAPLTVSFTASASGGTAPYTYSWSFGDGNSGTGTSPSHTYATFGTYTVVLTVSDANGTSKPATAIVITISGGGGGGNPLVIAATGAPAKGKAPLSVVFVSSVSGGTGPFTYSWDFKDGQVSDQQSPTHAFNKTGTYPVALKVTDAKGAVKTATVSVSVTGGSTDINTKKGFLPGFEPLIFLAAIMVGLLVLGHAKKRRR
jgi:PKD repeat protein